MPYFVTVFNRYSDGSELREVFDTNSVTIHEAFEDARGDAFVFRSIHHGKCDRPLIERITCREV